jgi:electron transport complex protein RnfC
MSAASGLSGSGTFARGIHPPYRKELAEDSPIEVLPTPAEVAVALLQHTGAPCEPLVKTKQEVTAGEMIGKSEAFISAPVHSPVNGTVMRGSVATLANARHVKTVPIKSGPDQLKGEALYEDIFGGAWPKSGLDKYSPQQIIESVREAGIVGMGGAAFPTHVKLSVRPDKPIDTILVNGCECEPYLTADHRLMVEAPAPIITGALLGAQACGADQIVIAVEDNKPPAIAKLREASAGTNVRIATVKTKYPMGGERQTVPAVLDREVPTGGLPLDIGVVVVNVATAAAIARAVLRGKPLTHRVVTVSGGGIVNPKNLLAAVGTTHGELIDYCGGCTADAVRIVAGGPMMGFTLGDLDAPVTKGTSGITVLTGEEARRIDETDCIRCGRCVDVCPLRLVPTKMALAVRGADWDLARRYYITACCECGCCTYTCPAGIPLVQLIRTGKVQIPED